ncbi:MAG TPA: acetyltransferase [Thermoanaerobaculia bacterium]|nr:acetyltransferase [Thermoanaerobaculia bacterium]
MLRAIVTIVLLMFNLLFWGTLVLLGGIVKFAVHMTAPRSRLRTRVILASSWLAERWVGVNDRVFDRMQPTRWDAAGPFDEIRHDGRYLIIANHVSWVDIFALFRVFHRRAPFIRFFLKHQLIWFPIVGQAVWGLEFPFLRRRPEHRQKDFETARRAAQRYRHVPVAIATFLEGTRFSEEKRDDQDSPYAHLLRPRTGAIAFVLATLGDQLDGMYDVTLAYPRGNVTLWEFLSGRVERIVIRARRLEVPPEFFAAAITEPGPARDRFKDWIDSIWREKDSLLESEIARQRDVAG